MDVTEIIEYNIDVLNGNDLANSFFHLDRHNPTVGFTYDATSYHGDTYPPEDCVVEPSHQAQQASDRLRPRLLVASHLAGHLRSHLEYQKGYTASVGISTSKLLAKLAGNVHKPNAQTTLLPPYTAGGETGPESNVIRFLDEHEIQKIPGIGSKLAHKLKAHVARTDSGLDSSSSSDPVTVRDVRLFPSMGPLLLDKILGGPGSPRGIGIRIWGLLHGVDPAEVSEARDVPTQISIEDTYRGLDTVDAVRRELVALTASLIRRMRTDLTEAEDEPEQTGSRMRWLAHPKTFRLSTRPRPPPSTGAQSPRTLYGGRISRSAPLPQFVFNLDDHVDALAERLVQDMGLSMFRKLHPEKSGWNLGLLNVAVTNMLESAGDQKKSSGRDIQKMFRTQETVLKEWRVTEPPSSTAMVGEVVPGTSVGNIPGDHDASGDSAWEESEEDETMPSVRCRTCGASIPHFAQIAHEMYHLAPDIG